LREDHGDLEEVISKDEIDGARSLEELIELTRRKIKA
jgi:hypothetical protein